ncbi:hypothetical protein WUBG_15737, partial [Wuchereria bancrofti]
LAFLVVQMPTAIASISQLIEEVKMVAANAEAEILISIANKIEMQRLNLKLQKAEQKSRENF